MLTAPFREFWLTRAAKGRTPGGRRTERLLDGWFERAGDEERGADLVTFSAEGTTPVWLGRTATGSVASVAVVVAGDHDPSAGDPLS
ncbi:hypothetical protein GT204_14760 [Streptomyces sp. SID4919]|nr:hypothetical protein [Streptomyces sp. SID4919]